MVSSRFDSLPSAAGERVSRSIPPVVFFPSFDPNISVFPLQKCLQSWCNFLGFQSICKSFFVMHTKVADVIINAEKKTPE